MGKDTCFAIKSSRHTLATFSLWERDEENRDCNQARRDGQERSAEKAAFLRFRRRALQHAAANAARNVAADGQTVDRTDQKIRLLNGEF